MTRVELLGSMQALSIYIFVRVDEGQTEDNDFDDMLQAAVTVCSINFPHAQTKLLTATPQRMSQLFNCNDHASEHQSDELVSLWQEWVIKESIKRSTSSLRHLSYDLNTDQPLDSASSIAS